MQSKASTVEEYLAQLPADRREPISVVRDVILKNLDKGFAEGMQYGLIGYYVPHELFPQGYHSDPSQPLMFAGLGSQKNYMSLYMMSLYGAVGCDDRDESTYLKWFRDAWAAAGKKLDMGKACIRFKKVEDLALDVIAEALRRVPANAYVERYQQLRAQYAAGATKAKSTGKNGKPAIAKKGRKKA